MSEKDKDKTQVNEDIQQHSNDIADDQQDDKDEEEEHDEETAQAIADYQAKIEKLDVKLNEFKDEHIESMKRSEMKAAHYTDSQIERYLSHIEGETIDEIRAYVFELTKEIPVSDPYGDPSAFNGAKAQPKTVDSMEIGRNAIKRVLHKIRL